MFQTGNLSVYWLGHDSFRLEKDNLVIYIDPYKVEEGKPADLILITHEHYDHLDPISIKVLSKEETTTVSPSIAAGNLPNNRVIAPGQTINIEGVEIKAVPAYNLNKPFHPLEGGRVGYLIRLDGTVVYHAGDSDLIPDMEELGEVYVALLPVSGTYVMDAEEAAKAVEKIKPRVAIPMHYGTIVGSIADAQKFKTLVGHKAEVVILEKE